MRVSIFDGQLKGYDIVLVARASESMPTFQQICRDVELVLQKARLFLDDSDAIPKQTDQRLSVDRICHEAQADVQPSKELVTDARIRKWLVRRMVHVINGISGGYRRIRGVAAIGRPAHSMRLMRLLGRSAKRRFNGCLADSSL